MTFCRKPLVFSSFSEVQRQPGQELGILSLVDLMAEPAVERINRNLIAFERLAWTYFRTFKCRHFPRNQLLCDLPVLDNRKV